MSVEDHQSALAEFTALREESVERLRIQSQLFALQLTVTGGVLGLVISHRDLIGLLLLLPFTSYMISSRFTAQETRSQLISRYIREQLASRVSGGLPWEAWWRENRMDIHRWLAPHLLLFPGSSIFALAWSTTLIISDELSLSARVGLLCLWLIGAASTVICAALVVKTARNINPRPTEKPTTHSASGGSNEPEASIRSAVAGGTPTP